MYYVSVCVANVRPYLYVAITKADDDNRKEMKEKTHKFKP